MTSHQWFDLVAGTFAMVMAVGAMAAAFGILQAV